MYGPQLASFDSTKRHSSLFVVRCGADSQSAAPALMPAHGGRGKKRVETSLDGAGTSARHECLRHGLPAVYNTVPIGRFAYSHSDSVNQTNRASTAAGPPSRYEMPRSRGPRHSAA